MIVGIKGPQDCGKTLTAVWLTHMLYRELYPLGWTFVGNLYMHLPGFHAYKVDMLREYLTACARDGVTRQVVVIDEADQVWSHRTWQAKGQAQQLLGMWQDHKRLSWFIWTGHLGLSVDPILRDATQIMLLPRYDKANDIIHASLGNVLDLETSMLTITKASLLFGAYDRWALVT